MYSHPLEPHLTKQLAGRVLKRDSDTQLQQVLTLNTQLRAALRSRGSSPYPL